MQLPTALLLLGPTGVGKTPLGEYLKAHGLHGRRCLHFDFGARLRDVASGAARPAALTEEGVAHVQRVLETGALLSAQEFWIAEALLGEFLRRNCTDPRDLVVLNGLPRHRQQAEAVDRLLDTRLVVHLDAPREVLLARIQGDRGGDRATRIDDDEGRVAARIARFHEHTLPLLDYYRQRGALIHPLPVEEHSQAEDLGRLLDSMPASL